jgi:hypothetical protein
MFSLFIMFIFFIKSLANQLYNPELIYENQKILIFNFPTDNGYFRYLSPINETDLMHGLIFINRPDYIQMDYMKMILGALFLGIQMYNNEKFPNENYS